MTVGRVEFGYQINTRTPRISSKQNFIDVVKRNPDCWLPVASGDFYEFYRVQKLTVKQKDAPSISIDPFKATNALSRAQHLVTTGGDGDYTLASMSPTKSIIYTYHPQEVTSAKSMNLEEMAPNNHKGIKKAMEHYLGKRIDEIVIELCKVEKKNFNLVGLISTTADKQNKGCFVSNMSEDAEIKQFAAQFQEILREMVKYGKDYTLPFGAGHLVIKDDNLSVDTTTVVGGNIPSASTADEVYGAMSSAVTESRGMTVEYLSVVPKEVKATIATKEEALKLFEVIGISKTLTEKQIPSASSENPTSSLLQFIQIYSLYKEDTEALQGVYRSDRNATTGATTSLFECKLTFKEAEIGSGRADASKRRAREEASRQVLSNLAKGVELLADKTNTEVLGSKEREEKPSSPPKVVVKPNGGPVLVSSSMAGDKTEINSSAFFAKKDTVKTQVMDSKKGAYSSPKPMA